MEKLIEGIQVFVDVYNKILNIEFINFVEVIEDIFSEVVICFLDKKFSLKFEIFFLVINGLGEFICVVFVYLIFNVIYFIFGDNVIVFVGYCKMFEVYEIWVKDYGSGIELEFQEWIFDLFYCLQDCGQS